MTRGATDARLEKLKHDARREMRRRPSATGRALRPTRASTEWRWPSAVAVLAKIVVVVALPFVLYVRASVWLYLHAGFAPWLAIAGAAGLTLGVAALYATWLSRRFSGSARAATIGRWVAFPLALAWCGYAALYLSRVNAKSDDVRGYYGTVHPVLRIALATAILGDAGLVVTDMRRVPADYARMGLPELERTKHYRQPNGWVHAADLRTIGHGELRNRALQLYFWTMGFETLRHVGTADHLHVQLPIR